MAVQVPSLATVIASDDADRKQVMTEESKPYYQSGIKLHEEGCGELVHEGLVIDSSLCLTAMMRLKRAVELNQTLVDANTLLAEIYLYRPSQMQWDALPERHQKKIFNQGFKHTLKAIEYAPTHPKALKLLTKYQEARRQVASE